MTIFTRTRETKSTGRSLTDIDADLLAWNSRREQLGRDLNNAKVREQDAVEKRGQLTAELVPDEKAVKAARSQHAAVVAEREEIEMAITTVDERLRGLEAERAQADRRRVITAALAALDRSTEIAARVDEDWDRVRGELVRFVQAADDASAALKGAYPVGHSFEIAKSRLTNALLWRVGDLLDLGYMSAGDRLSAVDLVSWSQMRKQLEAELAGQGERA